MVERMVLCYGPLSVRLGDTMSEEAKRQWRIAWLGFAGVIIAALLGVWAIWFQPDPLCEHESFGLLEWKQMDSERRSSGFSDSGPGVQGWCAQMEAEFIANRIGAGEPHECSSQAHPESARWRNAELRIGREYNYHCTVTCNWDPTYETRRDPICATS